MVIRINSMVKVGQDIRPVGCDIPVDRDNPLLPKFTSLSAIDIGLIASIGSESVKVFSKPVVAVLSTGDEVSLYMIFYYLINCYNLYRLSRLDKQDLPVAFGTRTGHFY